MYDYALSKALERVSALLFKKVLLKELQFQGELSDNGTWMFCYLKVLKNAFNYTNENGDFFSLLKEKNPEVFKQSIQKEFARQKYLMENQKSQINFFMPFSSFLRRALERIDQCGN